jgi:ketosteroid isomerase-like protein
VSQENIEIVRGIFDRWNRKERDFVEGEVHPDVEIRSRLQAEPYRGWAGLKLWMQEIDDQFEEWQLVVKEWRDTGDLVVGLGHIGIRGQGSGIEFDQPIGWLVELSEGKPRRMEFFVEPRDALAAAGLAE